MQDFYGHVIEADVMNARDAFMCYFITYDRLSAGPLSLTENLFQQEQLNLLDQVSQYQNNTFGMNGFSSYFFSLFGDIEAIYNGVMIITTKKDFEQNILQYTADPDQYGKLVFK